MYFFFFLKLSIFVVFFVLFVLHQGPVDGNVCRRKGSNHFGPVGCLKRQAPLERGFSGRHLIQSVVQVTTRGNKNEKKFEIGTRKRVSFQPEERLASR